MFSWSRRRQSTGRQSTAVMARLAAALVLCTVAIYPLAASASPPDMRPPAPEVQVPHRAHERLIHRDARSLASQLRHPGRPAAQGTSSPVANPQAIAFDGGTRTVYVATDAGIAVIDGRTCTAKILHCTPPIATMSAPNMGGLALDTATATLWLSEGTQVGAFDLRHCRAGDVTGCRPAFANIPTGSADFLIGVWLDPQSHTVYAGTENRHLWLVDGARCNATVRSRCGSMAGMATVPGRVVMAAADPTTHTLYVTSGEEGGGATGQLSVLDLLRCRASDTTGCDTPTATATLGHLPLFPVIDTSTRTLYVNNKDDSTESVVALTHCTAGDTTGCGRAARTFSYVDMNVMVIDARAHTLYVLQEASDRFAVIDTTHCRGGDVSGCEKPYATLQSGDEPWDMALDPSTGTLYNINVVSGDLRPLDAAHCNALRHSSCRREAPSTPGGDGGVAMDPGRHTYYQTDGDRGLLGVIDTRTCNITVRTSCGTLVTVPLGEQPYQTAIDLRTHTLYVKDLGTEEVHLIDTSLCNVARRDGCTPFQSVPLPRPGILAVNPVTHTVYVTLNVDTPQLAIIDGAHCNAIDRTGCTEPVRTIATTDHAGAPWVDPSTNTVYVTTESGDMDVIDGAACDAGTAGCKVVGTAHGVGNQAEIQDATRHTLYLANGSYDRPGSVTVMDTTHCRAIDITGCDANWPSMPTGRGTTGLMLDLASQTLFTANAFDATMNIIDVRHCTATDHSRCTQTSPRIAVGAIPVVSQTDPTYNTVYTSSILDRKQSMVDLRHPCANYMCFR